MPNIEKANIAFKKNPAFAFQILDSVYYKNKKTLSKSDEAEILYAYGKYYSRLQQSDSSIIWAKRGYEFVQKNEIDSMIADFANVLGGAYIMQNKPDTGAYFLLLAAENLEKQKEYTKSAYVYNNLANLFLDDKQFEKALEYFKKGEDIMVKQNMEGAFVGTLIGNMSFTYLSLDSLAQAKRYAQQAINIGQQKDDPTAKLYGILTLADLAAKKNDKTTAITKYKEAYLLATELEDDYKKSLCTAAMASFYLNSSPTDAVKYGLEAENYFKTQLPRFRVPNLLTLAQAFEKSGNISSAASYYKIYSHLTDSLAQADYQKLKLEMLEKYETAQKSAIITQQKSELVAKSLTNTRLFAGLLLALLALISALFWYQKQKQKTKEKLKLLQQEKEQTAMLAVVEGEQNERVRLAKDLHDGLANEIASLKMYTGLKNMDLHSPILNEIEQKLDILHQNTRNTAHNMLPKSFANEGLIASLKTLCDDYSAIVPTIFIAQGYIPNKRKSFELFVYRLAQEVISNAVKYADASKIDVKLVDTEKNITLTVSDNGKGITEDVVASGFSFIKTRLHELGGSMNVVTNAPTGTVVSITINYE